MYVCVQMQGNAAAAARAGAGADGTAGTDSSGGADENGVANADAAAKALGLPGVRIWCARASFDFGLFTYCCLHNLYLPHTHIRV